MLAEPMSAPTTPPTASDSEIAVARLAAATRAHEAGRLDEARALYLEALAINPHKPEAEHGLAWLLVQQGDWKGALPRFARALKLRPWEKEFWISQLEALMQVGQHEAVHRLLHRAAESGLTPDVVAGFEHRLDEHRLATLIARVKASGKTAKQAADAPRPALMAMRAAFLKRDFAEAREKASTVIRSHPLCAFAWRVLGASLPAGESDAAIEVLRIARDLDPENVDVRMNLALALQGHRRLDEAARLFADVLARQPENVRALVNMGLLLNSRNDEKAEQMLRRARALGDKDHRVALALGGYLRDRDKHDEATPLLEEALRADPDNAACQAALSVCYLGVGRHEEAAALFRRLESVGSRHLGALGIALFVGTHIAEIGPDELFSLHRRYGELVEGSVTPHAFWGNGREPERRLRLGFVSGDLRNHAMANFVLPLWKGLNRDAFEVFAYSAHGTNDAVTAKLRAHAQGWCDITGMSDERAADRIREDRIDVLVDLSGHTAFNRLGVFALKPAPVQLSWGGYPATTGLSRIDYYLADEAAEDAGPIAPQFSESLILLPASASFSPSPDAPCVAPLPSAQGNPFTFGSFNRMSKVTPETLELWITVLSAVPGSRLFIGAIDDPNRTRVVTAIERAGLSPTRITFEPRAAMCDYLDWHRHIDLLLDTLPYAGGTTTCHGLWMGVPTLTLVGETVPTRTGAVILGKIGIDGFIARDRDDFVRKAMRWSAPEMTATLAALRETMRSRLLDSTLCSPKVAIEGFEDAVQAAWQRWCAGLPPTRIVVSRRSTGESLG